MLAVHIQNSGKHYLTPVGPVPVDFEFIPELMDIAHIGYRDEFAESDAEKPQAIRTWYVVYDKKLIPSTRTTSTGKRVQNDKRMVSACHQHIKFCMIVDYIRHAIEKGKHTPDFPSVLRIAIGKQSFYETSNGGRIEFFEQIEKMRTMDWRTLRNTLARQGVHGYTMIGEGAELPEM